MAKRMLIYSTLLNTPTVRSRDEVLPASPLLSSKRQGNEVEVGKYPDRKVVGSLLLRGFLRFFLFRLALLRFLFVMSAFGPHYSLLLNWYSHLFTKV
jgi:hypothetical protein